MTAPLDRCRDHSDDRERDAGELKRRRTLAAREPVREWDDGRGCAERPDDSHRPDRKRTIERGQPEEADGSCECAPAELRERRRVRLRDRDDDADADETNRLRRDDHERDRQPPCAHTRAEIRDAPREARRERQQNAAQLSTGLVAATASSWFAWYSTAASAVRAARTS